MLAAEKAGSGCQIGPRVRYDAACTILCKGGGCRRALENACYLAGRATLPVLAKIDEKRFRKGWNRKVSGIAPEARETGRHQEDQSGPSVLQARVIVHMLCAPHNVPLPQEPWTERTLDGYRVPFGPTDTGWQFSTLSSTHPGSVLMVGLWEQWSLCGAAYPKAI